MGTRPTPAPPEQREQRPRRSRFELLYLAGVLLKGIDGAIELLAAMVLLVAPGLLFLALDAAQTEALENPTITRQFIAAHVDKLSDTLATNGLALVIAYLAVHGAIKLALVYCLLRRYHRVYPIALGVLGAFLLFQLYELATAPSITLAVISAVDAVIIYLIYGEYRRLRRQSTV